MLTSLFRLGAGGAILGGTLRIAAAFLPVASGSPSLEAFYAVIDLSLLFGLTAIYANDAEALGWPGVAAFAVSFAGLASIVGPDATMFGVDWYRVGATISAVGLMAFGAALLVVRRQALPAICWIMVPAAAVGLPASIALAVSGVLFGAGFVVAGISMLTQPAAGTG